nr:FAD-binding oxidoreductase [Microbacterium hydrocarbonoxydans]
MPVCRSHRSSRGPRAARSCSAPAASASASTDRSRAEAVARIAASGLGLFPALRDVGVQRAYSGFRPYCPDHLPAIGEDARLPGLWHAAGHEGAGVGLSVGTGKLLSQALRSQPTDLDLTPFRPERLEGLVAA